MSVNNYYVTLPAPRPCRAEWHADTVARIWLEEGEPPAARQFAAFVQQEKMVRWEQVAFGDLVRARLAILRTR